MDNGFITGSNGKVADGRNTILIMTSNLGAADNERNNIGFGRSLERTGEDDKAVKDFFKPEFRNRLDAIIKFNKLEQTSIRKIVDNTNQATAGQRVISIKSSLDYNLGPNLTAQVYFDQVLNRPKIATSYPTANTMAGIRLRLNLGGM